MALTQRLSSGEYTTLFTILGEFVEVTNRFDGLYAAFDTDLAEIEADLNTQSLLRLYDGVSTAFDGYRSGVLSWISSNNSKIANILVDKRLLLDTLNMGSSTGIQQVLHDLIIDMNDATQSVTASVVTIGAITTGYENTDPGTLLVDATLDGVTAPHPGVSAHLEYAGKLSQLALTADDLRVVCSADTNTGQTAYNESFELIGNSANNPYHHLAGGSGNGPTLTPIHSQSIISGLQFTTFTVANTPDNWTITSGAAGTEIFKETSAPYEGTNGLKLVGTSTDATLTNTVTTSNLTPDKRYLFCCYIKSDGLTTGGTLTIMLTGTGYTATSSEKISMNEAALDAQTSYGLESFYITMPSEIPTDLKLQIDYASGSAGNVFIDFCAFGEVDYFNGCSFAIASGTDLFVVNDEMRLSITNNNAGVWQTFFRKAFDVQIPTSGSPTQADSLAT